MKTIKTGWGKMLTVGMPALFGALLTAMVLAGCVSSKAFVWDETLSEGQAATLDVITGNSFGTAFGIRIKSYNGIPVEGTYGTFTIPAGDAEFVADITWTSGSGITEGEDLSFSYHFEAGKEYILIAEFGGERKRNPAISVYRGRQKGLSMPPKDNLLDEIIFERQQHVMTAGSK